MAELSRPDYRLRIADPAAAIDLGAGEELIAYDSWRVTGRRNEQPRLTVAYPRDMPRAGHLFDPSEAWVEFTGINGEYNIGRSCHFALSSTGIKRADDDRTLTSVFVGWGEWTLSGMAVIEQSAWDPGKGAVKPEHDFTGATAGHVMRTTILDNHDAGFGPDLEFGFNSTIDSNGNAWSGGAADVGRLVVPVGMPADQLLDLLANGIGVIDYYFLGRELRMFNRGGFSRDLAVDSGTTLWYAAGVEFAPETTDYSALCDTVYILGDNGLIFPVVNEDAVPMYGSRLKVGAFTWVQTQADADLAAQPTLTSGRRQRDQITRDVSVDLSQFYPLRDLRLDDYVYAERREGGADDPEKVVIDGWSFGEEASGEFKASYFLNDRLARAEQSALLRLARVVNGVGGWAGEPRPPGDDPRKPDTPDAPTVTFETYLNPRGEPRGRAFITFTLVSTTHDTIGGVEEPIDVPRYRLERRLATDKWEGIRIIGADFEQPIPNDELRIGVTVSYRMIAISHTNVESEPSSGSTPEAPVDDTDPRDRGRLVEDPNHVSVQRNAARAAATTGLTFVAEGTDTVAALSTTSTILKYGVGATSGSGRFRVLAADTVHTEVRLKRTGFSAATAKVQVFYSYDDGTSGTQLAATAVTTGSYVTYGGITSPTKDGFAELRVIIDSLTGTGSVRAYGAYGTRQSETKDIKVGAITADLINVGTLNGVHITGLIIDAGQLNASAISFGTMDGTAVTAVTIDGAVITGGKLTTGTGNIVIDDDTISLGSAVMTFSGSLVTVSGGFAAAGSLSTSSALTVTGSATIGGTLDHNGGEIGVLGASPRGVWGVSAAAADLASVITLANNMRSAGLDFGFFN